jgi:hypothetical protein
MIKDNLHAQHFTLLDDKIVGKVLVTYFRSLKRASKVPKRKRESQRKRQRMTQRKNNVSLLIINNYFGGKE